ncbi:PAS domain-containing sensor histidine kinase [Bacillus tianshenii]|nr:PAS domain-containing sensor histidine kinase [Bacillus tianshenii]
MKGSIELSRKQDTCFQELVKNHLDTACLILNKDLQVQFVNDSFVKFIEKDAGEMIGESLDRCLNGHILHNTMMSLIKEVLFINQMVEHIYYTEDVFYQLKAHILEESQNICVMLYDHSYQQKFENLLVYKEQMDTVAQLAAGVAHELRNPLAVIRGFFQLSKMTKGWDKYYETIMAEMIRMEGIIEEFLSMARKNEKKEQVYLHEVLGAILNIIRAECLLHDIEFRHNIVDCPHYVLANEAMIKQVMLNLLRNAIEAFDGTESSPQFSLTTAVSSNHYVVRVQDNGPGIPEDILLQLGQPFFTTKENGTGIGLAMCKKIIHDYNGTFRIESEVGVGTTVSFSFPLA